jgi:diguanylate cyclase (GGDEF)-like protein
MGRYSGVGGRSHPPAGSIKPWSSILNLLLDQAGHGRSRRELETSIVSAIYAMTRAQFVRLHTLVELDGETLAIVSSHVDDNGVFWTSSAGNDNDTEWTVAAELLSDHPLMQRAVCQHAPVRKLESSSGLHHCFYPVCIHGKVHGIVELKENHRPYPDEDALISSFIALYINYVHWLDGSDRDPLTGALKPLLLESAMHQVLTDVTPRGTAQGCGYCLALASIDHYGDIVQCYGQLFGDEILRRLFRELQERFGESGRIYGLGDDGFAVLLPAQASKQVEIAFSEFLEHMAGVEFPNLGSLQISVGLSQLAPGDESAGVLERARRALAKAQSHNPKGIRRPGAR